MDKGTLALDLARLGTLKKMAFASFPKPSILVSPELRSECRHRARGPPAAAGHPPSGEGAAHPRLQGATPWGATPRSLASALTGAERGSAGAHGLRTGAAGLRQGQHGDGRLLAQLVPSSRWAALERPLAELGAVPGFFLPLIGLRI